MERLKERYRDEIVPAMMQKFNYKNINETPRLDKVVVNIGMGEAVQEPKALDGAIETIRVCIKERIKRYNSFAEEWSLPVIEKKTLNKEYADMECLVDWKPDMDHDEWVWGLAAKEKQDLRYWLASVAENQKSTLLGSTLLGS